MVTYTSSATYWAPLKPRIRIYAFNDSTYASPLYSYNPFTDVGESTKPISLAFDTGTTNVGSFSIEIEDQDSALDPDTYSRGNRVFIDCSKDGSTFQPAFKGLVRGTDQNIYATSGRNLVLNGYSYLIRLNERVLNTIKESSFTGTDYNRTDSNMFTDNLINDLLTTNSNYVYSDDDTALYSIFKKTNITSSPITDWIPRLDAQLVTVNDAINSVLEFSNGLIMMNPADDELMLYSPDLITSATSIFLLTNQVNQSADDADYTMYPLEPYKYNVSYDYPDSSSRLIGSIGGAGNPCVSIDTGEDFGSLSFFLTTPGRRNLTIAWHLESPGALSDLGVVFRHTGDVSFVTSITAKILGFTSQVVLGDQIGSDFFLYRDGIVDKPFPNTPRAGFIVSMAPGATGPTLPASPTIYHLVLIGPSGQNIDNRVHWSFSADKTSLDNGLYGWTNNAAATTWSFGGSTTNTGPLSNAILTSGYDLVLTETTCGGVSQATVETDPVFAVAQDKNMSARLGVVERVITGIPTHIKTRQTLQEYLFNKLSVAAKPRFTFDFPSVSMPNKMPKAGDICAHVDSMANVGTANSPVQTGVINSVQYDFAQGSDGALGLRKIGLSTTGIKRGSY